MAKVKYFFKKRSVRAAFHLLDLSLKPLSKKPAPIKPPESILLCNGAHIGDCIATTALLQPLKAAFPSCRIDMLVGSCSKQVLEGHPLVDNVITFDHWKLHQKKSYLKSRSTALQALSAANYDVAIDCPFHFPNCAPLLWQANIQSRIGFQTAGFAPLLTHALPWKSYESIVEAFFALACLLPGVEKKRNELALYLPTPVSNAKGNYLVFHPCSRDPKKAWSLENWKNLTASLLDAGHEIYFTGHGQHEYEYIEKIIPHGSPRAHNKANTLTWKEFTGLIAECRALVAVDTCAGHVAASFKRPSLTLLGAGMLPWKPFSSTSIAAYIETATSQTIHKQLLELLRL